MRYLLALILLVPAQAALPKVKISPDGRSFITANGQPFVPFGINYYRPGTGWAPQVWKKWDAEATRRDFQLMRSYGVNCVRVFLSYGSQYDKPGELNGEGLAKLDEFMAIAEEHGIYVHPTGPDHWEGTPEWARADRVADEKVLAALEDFWRLLAARYKDRAAIFSYDLRNEPEVAWNNPVMERRWAAWVQKKYPTREEAFAAWNLPASKALPTPEIDKETRKALLLDYHRFREDVADEWTRRQSAAIKAADPNALVTVGLIQWSVPSVLPRTGHYSGFAPRRQAPLVDFLSVHFYPLAEGAYEYRQPEDELKNLAYLHSVVREVAAAGKPVVIGEFGWYGGGKPTFDNGRRPAATEEQQAAWCRKLVETTSSLACGWLNWGFYDQPEATDVSQMTGLMRADGSPKSWGREFKTLARRLTASPPKFAPAPGAPPLPWDECITDLQAAARFREKNLEWFRASSGR